MLALPAYAPAQLCTNSIDEPNSTVIPASGFVKVSVKYSALPLRGLIFDVSLPTSSVEQYPGAWNGAKIASS